MADSDVQVKFGADITDFSSKLGVLTSATKGYDQELVNALNAHNLASSAVVRGMEAASKATNEVNFATAGATREYLVLGREVMTGNFSRIPGSLVVLASRLGALQSIMESVTPAMIAWAGGIGAAVFTIYEWIAAIEQMEETQRTVAGAMDMSGQSLSYNADEVARNILYMREYESISGDEAQKIAVAFARIPGLTSQMTNELIRYVVAWQQLTGAKDSTAAAENLAKVFSEPAKSADELAKKYPELVTADEAWRVQQDETANGAQHAAEMLLNDIGPKLQQFNTRYVEPSIGYWEQFKRVITDVANPIGSFNLIHNQATPAPQTSDQTAAIQAQQHQLQLNDAESQGLQIVKSIHGENEILNTLIEKRATLVTAANAAMEKGDDDLVVKYQQGMQDADQKIAAEKKRMNAEAVADAKRATQEEIAIERDQVNTQLEIDNIALQSKRDALQEEVAEHRITKQQELQIEQQFAGEEYNLSYNALMQELQLGNLSALQKQQLYDKIQVLYAKHMAEMGKLSTQMAQGQDSDAKKTYQSWMTALTPIETAFDGMLTGVLQGSETISQALANMFSNMAISIVESILKVIAEWLVFELVTEGQGTWNEFVAIKGGGASGGGFLGSIGKIAGFDIGSNYVPQTGLAIVHEGEQIIPAGMQGPGYSGGDGPINVTFQIQAIDTQTGANFIQQNAASIASVVAGAIRNNNSSLSNAMRAA